MSQTETKPSTIQSAEQGFASLVVGLILVVVLALLTVGFAQLTRHEEQQALTKQLASQAYYAAETGINDAVKVIQDAVAVDPVNPVITGADTNQCIKPLGNPPKTYSNVVDANNLVQYSCVLINLNTSNLLYRTGAGDGRSVVTSTSTPLSSLTITWSSQGGQTAYKNTPSDGFNPTSAWNGAPGVIQFSITPLGGANVTRSAMLTNTYTAFLYPSKSAAPVTSYNTSQQAPVVSGNCDVLVPDACSVTISNLLTSVGGPYLLHFLNLYDASDVTITGAGAPGLGAVTFSGGQASVDATGKAHNVLKRLQVRVKVGDSGNDLANYILEAKNICKRMATQSGSTLFYEIAAGDTICNNDPSTAPATLPGDGTAIIQGCITNCTNDGNPFPGKYGWQKGFTNASPADQDAHVTGCTWAFSGSGFSNQVVLINAACNSGQTTPKFDFHALLGIDDSTFPAYDGGCHTIRLTMVLTIYLNNTAKPATTNKKFNVPSCFGT